jgi:Holliday junction resolvasome RuvABC endonuclease subunit
LKALLGIDPGTNCGWALRFEDGSFLSGVWNLKGGRFSGGGMRFVHLRSNLEATRKAADIDRVAFEEVRRHLGVDAAHVYGGIVATLTSWCEEHSIPYSGIPVGTVKKLATGKGNANKDAMIAAAAGRWPAAFITNDNEADARFIALAALEQ